MAWTVDRIDETTDAIAADRRPYTATVTTPTTTKRAPRTSSARTRRVVVPHLTVDERVARGKAARREVPRSTHAELNTGVARPDPIDLLEQQAQTRVPELVPIRYGRMLVSPFTFYRGAALIMASDLSGGARSGLNVQLCGDAHLMNFGVFNTPERRMVFDINDFDETAQGPFEWDVKRLAASFAIAGRDNGFSTKERRKALLAVSASYRNAMAEFAGMTNLAVWYTSLDIAGFVEQSGMLASAKVRKRAEANLDKARTKDSLQAFEKLTHVVNGERRIISDPPLIEPIEDIVVGASRDELVSSIHELIARYRQTLQIDRRHLLEQFRVVHMARKVVGVGSVGTRAWIILLLGRDDSDPLFLQAKEAQRSVLEPFTGASRFRSSGQRIVAGQHLMQASSDIFLGYESVEGVDGVKRDYYVRQLRDGKGSASVELMDPPTLAVYATLCGRALARAHARSGDRIAIASYLGAGDIFDQAIADFSETYADQTERDYDALVAAETDGRVAVVRGL
jgi:uncharacterized protein (DUF2252 family)